MNTKPKSLGGKRVRKKNLRLLRQIGERIKQRRNALGMTAQALAEALEIDRTNQYNRESGKAEFTASDLDRYAKALDCQIGDLLP